MNQVYVGFERSPEMEKGCSNSRLYSGAQWVGWLLVADELTDGPNEAINAGGTKWV